MKMALCLLLASAFLLVVAGGFGLPSSSLISKDGDHFVISVEDLVKQAALGLTAEIESVVGETDARRVKRSTAVTPLDAIIDFLLAGAVPQVISQGNSSIPVPDFSFSLAVNLGDIFNMSVSVNAVNGTLQDMKSLFRQGPAVVKQEPKEVLVLQVAVGFRTLILSYDSYNASVDGTNFSGQLQMVMSPTVMSAQVQLVAPCSVQLRSLQLSQLGKLQLKITGLPNIFSTIPAIIEHLYDRSEVHNEIANIVVSQVSRIVTEQLRNLTCR